MFALKPLASHSLWVLSTAAWSLVACGYFLIFGGLFDDGHDEGRSELACAKAKLEELWDMPLPADLEVVGSIPKPEVANADWDLRKLGCSAETYLAATLQLRK